MNRATAGLVVAFLLASIPSHAQSVDQNDRIKALSSLAKTDAEYRLGPGDLIEISVFGVESFRHTLRISASGIIKLPLLDPITATGLTSAELEHQLATLLRDDVIKNPQVSVFVKEYRSQSVHILGAVKSPGQYQIALQLRIVDVISMAGGLLPTAEDDAMIQRASPEGGDQIIPVNLNALLEKGDLALNVVVHGGDVIHIRERTPQNVFMVGEVNRGGAYVIPPRQSLRVTQVFAWAGGPMKTAKLSDGILIRYNEKGEREAVPVNFSDILKGKKEDFIVKANDIIFVPGSKSKTFGYGMLAALPGTLTSVPFWFIP